jgi:hypothetical protein
VVLDTIPEGEKEFLQLSSAYLLGGNGASDGHVEVRSNWWAVLILVPCFFLNGPPLTFGFR